MKLQLYVQIEDTKRGLPIILDHELKPLKMLFTSDKLLAGLAISANLHVDSTYNLKLYGFPAVTIGVSEVVRRFYCSGICLAENENAEIHDWFF